MKKTFALLLGIAELIAAAVFLANIGSDVQLGFGLLFLFLGIGALLRLWAK